jgi:hypothetical protein
MAIRKIGERMSTREAQRVMRDKGTEGKASATLLTGDGRKATCRAGKVLIGETVMDALGDLRPGELILASIKVPGEAKEDSLTSSSRMTAADFVSIFGYEMTDDAKAQEQALSAAEKRAQQDAPKPNGVK